MVDPEDLETFRRHLAEIPAGKVAEAGRIEESLSRCWDAFEGSGETSMEGGKLHARMEKVYWYPPTLSFEIVRHGATAKGATRGERYRWTLDLECLTVTSVAIGFAQLYPPSAPVDAEAVAEKVARLIDENLDHDWLKWRSDHRRVTVLVGRIPQLGGDFKQTVAGRRKRFAKALAGRLIENGWKPVSGTMPHTYERPS